MDWSGQADVDILKSTHQDDKGASIGRQLWHDSHCIYGFKNVAQYVPLHKTLLVEAICHIIMEVILPTEKRGTWVRACGAHEATIPTPGSIPAGSMVPRSIDSFNGFLDEVDQSRPKLCVSLAHGPLSLKTVAQILAGARLVAASLSSPTSRCLFLLSERDWL